MPALQVSPIVAVLDQAEVSLDRVTVPRVALSLVEAFERVPDPRQARGIRHGVVAIADVGGLRGADRRALLRRDRRVRPRHRTTVLDTLGVGAVVPHACTIRRVLSRLDPAGSRPRCAAWSLAQLADRPAPDGVPAREQRQVIAVDGKTVRVRHEVACGEWITSWRLPMGDVISGPCSEAGPLPGVRRG